MRRFGAFQADDTIRVASLGLTHVETPRRGSWCTEYNCTEQQTGLALARDLCMHQDFGSNASEVDQSLRGSLNGRDETSTTSVEVVSLQLQTATVVKYDVFIGPQEPNR